MQNSQENTCVEVTFFNKATLLKNRLRRRFFLWILPNFWGDRFTEHIRTTAFDRSLALVKFSTLLTLSAPEKLKNWIFEIPIIPQTLNINNLRTTASAKYINLNIIVKLIKYSWKIVFVKVMFTLTVSEILLFTGSERVNLEIFYLIQF